MPQHSTISFPAAVDVSAGVVTAVGATLPHVVDTEPSAGIDASWEAMVDGMTFTPANYIDNCDTFAAWYAENTGYATDGVVLADLTQDTGGDLQFPTGGTQANPTVVEGLIGGPPRWDADWITFRHCLFTTKSAYGGYANPTFGTYYTGIRFENCSWIQDPPVDNDCLIIYGKESAGDYFGTTFIQCDISGWGGGLKASGGMYAKYCYIHDMQASSVAGQHVTCSTARKGRHHMIRCMATDGGSGGFNVYHEDVCSDLLYQENVIIGMSPNSTMSYGMDNAKGDLGYAAQATNMRWIDNMCGEYVNPPNSATYRGIQYGAFSSTDGMSFGEGGNATKTGNFYIYDGRGF